MMAYIFRCDACGYEELLDMPCPPELHRNCEDCGEEGCKECLPTGRCEYCIGENAEPDDRGR